MVIRCRSAVVHNSSVAKIEMRVIPESEVRGREVHMATRAGSVALGGSADGSRTFVCGRCRDILAPGLDPDAGIVWRYDEENETFSPMSRFRDIVIKCKGCGAYNELRSGSAPVCPRGAFLAVRRPGLSPGSPHLDSGLT
jgi:hypothetical protein